MLILGIDTSAVTCAVALLENETLLAQETVAAGKAHSEVIMVAIDHLLQITHKKISDIELIAISEGPGSFTGVRIGVSVVKGLAFGDRIPTVGVSTLEALAYNLLGVDGVICAVMDARRNQVYHARFVCKNGMIERISADDLLPLAQVEEELAVLDAPIWLVGDGYKIAKRTLKNERILDTPPLLCGQNGYSVGLLGYRTYLADQSMDTSASARMPRYLRASQAERERLEREKAKENNNG
jgi:tRNA threonylcarbamoyladenosine biosynthesis protein TsaB